jgi:hypothetical protein
MLSLGNISLGNWVSQRLWRASSVTEIGLAKPCASVGDVSSVYRRRRRCGAMLTTLMLRLSLPATRIESEAVLRVRSNELFRKAL